MAGTSHIAAMFPPTSPSARRPSTSRSELPPLPPNHFLSLPPTHFSSVHPSHPPTLSHLSAGVAPNTASTASADFDVDVRTGFLPPEAPVSRLQGEYEVWEKALEAARGGGVVGKALRLGGGDKETLWRRGVQEMPIVSTETLQSSLPNLRRAHLVLTFLMHFYVHCQPIPSIMPRTQPISIPPSISVPLLQISPLLGLPPILTYSDTVLYNSHPVDSTSIPSFNSNPLITSLETFTNTTDEAHFFLTSARCELAGVVALDLMRRSLDEAFIADSLALTRLTTYLTDLAGQIDLIGDVIVDVKNGCRPDVFYHVIRPWFRGGDADGPESAGWLFEGVEAADQERLVGASGAENRQTAEGAGDPGVTTSGRKFSGPSAGQSTLIHALDVFLMVDHRQQSEESDASNEETFMQRMKAYMPHPHRSFLTHLADAPHPIRSLVLANRETRPDLAAAYDGALAALKRLRDKHMRIVTMYIIQQARREVSDEMIAMGAPVPASRSQKQQSTVELPHGSLSDLIEEQESKKAAGDDELRGTGGTALIKFLKLCRDNTMSTMVGGGVRPQGGS